MKWTKEEVEYFKNSYPNNPNIWEISKELNKTIKALHRKAQRLGIKRKKFSKLSKSKQSKKSINKRYYNKNKDEIYKRKKERIKKKREEFRILLGGKCSKCGYKKCFQALEFHHKSGKKEEHLSLMIKNFSKQKSLKEIEKCILLCANCHRELHAGV